MLGMMTPDMMKMAKSQYNQNPDHFKQQAEVAHKNYSSG